MVKQTPYRQQLAPANKTISKSGGDFINSKLNGDLLTVDATGKTLIVEFMGPTGCGKSTNCNQFVKCFQRYDVPCYVFKDVKDYLYSSSNGRKALFAVEAIGRYLFKLVGFSWVLIRTKTFSFNSIYRYAKLCFFETGLRSFIKDKKPGIVLLDQWIIQGLWSATIFKTNTVDSLVKHLHRFFFDVDYLLYFTIDPLTASQRIQHRTVHVSRFDSLSQRKQMEELANYSDYLHHLFVSSPCRNKMVLSAINNPETNAEDFIRFLIEVRTVTHGNL